MPRCNLTLHIHVVINWQLSKQGIRWPVPSDLIADLGVDPWSRSSIFFRLSPDKFLVFKWSQAQVHFFKCIGNKLCLWAALIEFWLQSHLGQCLHACLHALSGLWTCKQWKSKNIWIWPRESLHPPSHPPPRLHYTNKVSVTDWRTEGKWGNREWCSNAANHYKNELFHRWFRIWWWFYRLSHVRSDWYIKTSKQPLNSVTWQLIDRWWCTPTLFH